MFIWFAMDLSDSLAMPGLDFVTGAVPMFDLYEDISIDPSSFDNDFAYVAENS